MDEGLKDFEQWKEVTKGIYRYVVIVGCCYEIVLLDYTHKTNILDAKAILFVTGEWYEHETGRNYFEREQLKNGTVKECIEAAVKDYDEEMILGR